MSEKVTMDTLISSLSELPETALLDIMQYMKGT